MRCRASTELEGLLHRALIRDPVETAAEVIAFCNGLLRRRKRLERSPPCYHRVHASLAMCSSPCHAASMRSSARRSVAASTWLRAECPTQVVPAARPSPALRPAKPSGPAGPHVRQAGLPRVAAALHKAHAVHGLNAVRRAQDGLRAYSMTPGPAALQAGAARSLSASSRCGSRRTAPAGFALP